MHSKMDQGLTFNFFAICLAIVTVQIFADEYQSDHLWSPTRESARGPRSAARRDGTRAARSAKKDRRASVKKGRHRGEIPGSSSLFAWRAFAVCRTCGKRSPIKRRREGWQLSAYLEEQHEADPLIVRVVFPRVDIPEVVGHSWMGDLHADLRKHETSAAQTITMTPRYMHPTRDKAIWPSLNVDNEKPRSSLHSLPLVSVSFLLEANAGTSCGLRRWQYEVFPCVSTRKLNKRFLNLDTPPSRLNSSEHVIKRSRSRRT